MPEPTVRLAVLGAGMMGRAVAWEFLQHASVSSVLLADADGRSLEEAAAFLSGTPGVDRLRTERADLSDEETAGRLLEGLDAALSAVPFRFNEGLARACIRAGTHFCDMGGNNLVVDAELALDEAARSAGVSIVPDCGLAPGLTNSLVAALLEETEAAEQVRIRVGGLPAHPRPPLHYKLVFSPGGLINEYVEPCRVLRDGEIVEVAPLSEPEEVEFQPPFGILEARHTSGGSSTLPATYRSRLRFLDYKTLRYPGHFAVMEGMLALGLFSGEPLDVDGMRIAPRRVVEERLATALSDSDSDVVLLRVTAVDRGGRGTGFELIDTGDGLMSAMQRTTALPAAIVCRMMADGRISPGGARPPEQAVPPAALMSDLVPYGFSFQRISE